MSETEVVQGGRRGAASLILASAACMLVASAARAGLCDGHAVCRKWTVRRGADISVKTVIRVGTGPEQVIPADRRPIVLGASRVGTTMRFEVEAHDADRHVCRTPQPVFNFLKETEIGVDVYVQRTGAKVTSIPLRRNPASGMSQWFYWQETWTIPSGAGLEGEWLEFRFTGVVDDYECTADKHLRSHDADVNMSDYKAKLAVPKIEGIDGYVYGESGRKIENMQACMDPSHVIASGYMKFAARVAPADAVDLLYFAWSSTAGIVVNPTGAGSRFLELKWDAPDGDLQDVTVTLTVKDALSMADVCMDDIGIQTVRPYVVKVAFVDDLFDEEQQITDGGDPEYDAVRNEVYPVCYVMHKGMQTQLDIAGSADLTKKTPVWVTASATYGGQSNPFNEHAVDDITENWEPPNPLAMENDVEIESDENLPNYVGEFEDFEMRWTFKVKNWRGQLVPAYTPGGGAAFSQKTEHVRDAGGGEKYGLFLIYSVTRVPASEFTMKHINYACETAQGHRRRPDICNAIHGVLSHRFDLHCYSANDWAVVDEHSSCTLPYCPWAPSTDCWDCTTLSRGMVKLITLLGIDGAGERKVYPSTNRNCLDIEPVPPCGIPGHGAEDFLVWCGGWNVFESTCYVDGQYYLGGIQQVHRSDLTVLRSWLGNDSQPPGVDDDGVFQCYTSASVHPPDMHDYCRIVPCP